MQLKLSFYEFKIDCYSLRLLHVIFKVTTKKVPVEYTYKKMRRESTCVTTKKPKKQKPQQQLNTNEDSKEKNERQQIYDIQYIWQLTKWRVQ